MKTGINVRQLRIVLPRVQIVTTQLDAQLGKGSKELQGAVQRILRSPTFKLQQVALERRRWPFLLWRHQEVAGAGAAPAFAGTVHVHRAVSIMG